MDTFDGDILFLTKHVVKGGAAAIIQFEITFIHLQLFGSVNRAVKIGTFYSIRNVILISIITHLEERYWPLKIVLLLL